MLWLSNKRKETKAVETGILKMGGGCSESCAIVYRYRKSRPGSITEMSNRSPGGERLYTFLQTFFIRDNGILCRAVHPGRTKCFLLSHF